MMQENDRIGTTSNSHNSDRIVSDLLNSQIIFQHWVAGATKKMLKTKILKYFISIFKLNICSFTDLTIHSL